MSRFPTGLRGALVLLAAAPALTSAGVARAGGDLVDLAAGGSRVWLVGEPGIRELDARTGKLLWSARLPDAAYPTSVALAAGAVWVAGVANGGADGTVTRIDLRTHRLRTVHRASSPVFYLAAGAGGVWALIGRSGIARFDPGGRLAHLWRIPGAGRLAADASGCWISTDRRLLHLDVAGMLRRVVRARLGDVAAGGGAAWLPQAASVLRIDERTGRVRRLATGPLALGGFQHDLAADRTSLWALRQTGRTRALVERLDPHGGGVRARTGVPGIADAIALTTHAAWIATVIAPGGSRATGYDLIRVDRATLRHTLHVHVG